MSDVEKTWMDRLDDGKALLLDDQMRTYITKECGKFVVRKVLALDDEEAKDHGERPPYIEVLRYDSFVEALLSLTDYYWTDRR